MSNSARSEDGAREHLDGLESGAGCTEIWERLSDERNETESPNAD
ncbi:MULTISPECIES: hypothetical protein [Salinibaculum]